MYQNLFSKIIFFSILFSICIHLGCKKNKKDNKDGQIPNVYVNFYIYLNDPSFAGLNSIGNSEIVTGGIKGILIHRATFNDFLAFDRVSSYQPSNLCTVNIDSTLIYAIDTCSKSKFSLMDGSVVTGPATLPLKQYRTEFDGNNTIHVFN